MKFITPSEVVTPDTSVITTAVIKPTSAGMLHKCAITMIWYTV